MSVWNISSYAKYKMAYYAVLKLSIYYRYYFEVSIILGLHEGGFPLGEIFRPGIEIFFCLTSTRKELNRNLLNLNNRNFGSIEKFRLVENRLK
jgi:hypothetical protein